MKEEERLSPAAEESGAVECAQGEGEETTRRSELPAPSAAQTAEKNMTDEELFDLVRENEGVRARVLGEYLQSLKGVPLMTGGGAGVTAPVRKPKNIREAGALALGYLKKKD